MVEQKNPFGLLAFLHWNHPWNKYHFSKEILPQAIDQIYQLGIRMVRIDILWSDVAENDKPLVFSRYDDLIQQLHQKDIQTLGVLQYNKDQTHWNDPPESFEEFASYVHQTVGHYKNEIHYWEIWNEPNHPMYWSAPMDRLKTYIKLLSLSYSAAKKADPTCQVLNGGLSHPIVEDVKNFFDNGGGAVMDIFNIHPFLDPLSANSPKIFDEMLVPTIEILKQHGGGKKKIWITEMGCPGVPGKNAPPTWFAGKSPTEEQQAEWLKTQYDLIKKYPQIEKLFWAFYRDTDKEFNDGTDYLGLVHFDLSPKPAFWMMKKLIQETA